jgi:hypothetical protein
MFRYKDDVLSLNKFVDRIYPIDPLPKGTIVSVTSFLAASSIKDILIGATNSGISYHLREIYSICRSCWNVATNKSFVVITSWFFLHS